jgi:hypothetical protein
MSTKTTHQQFAGNEDRALEILERGTWGDIGYSIYDLEVCLALLCEATRPWFSMWEDVVSPALDEKGVDVDEFALSGRQVRELSDEWRLAYTARLVETLCLQYGWSPPG